MICAKCGRKFTQKNHHLLTVHHKEGDPGNNARDDSNWENLCVYCHEDEHSRKLMVDYLSGK
ncbi:MAG: HNH endonuclease [Desulfobaccales bacterium]